MQFPSWRLPALGLLFAAGNFMLACGDPTPPDVVNPATIVISPGVDTLYALGQTVDLVARALDEDGEEILGVEFEWSCLNCDVADVVANTGRVTARANGKTDIRARIKGDASNLTAVAEINVYQVATSVTISPEAPVLNTIGATQEFSAAAVDALGNPIANASFLWISGDHRVATISGSGGATATAKATGAGTATIIAAVQGVPGNATLTVNQAAASLAFLTNPSDGIAGAAVSPAIQVEVRDGSGNRVSGSEAAITLAIATGPGVLSGTHTVRAVNGVATFSGIWFDKVGDYTLTASAADMTAATSGSFAVAAGAPARLSFTTEPVDAEGNEPIALAVTITDDWDNLVPSGTNAVTVRFDNNPEGAMLLGSTTANAVDGVATFSVRIDRPGVDYALEARADGLLPALSGDFAVQLNFTKLASGPDNYHLCGLTAGGHAYCWGYGPFGQLGNGSTVNSGVPVLVSGGYTFKDISVGVYNTCAVTTNNAAYCWGHGGNGRLGNGQTVSSSTPVPVSGGHAFKSITVGNAHSCAIDTNDAAWCWGYNGNGQLGNNTTTEAHSPVAVGGGTTLLFAAIDAGQSHTCGIAGGNAYCWGYDGHGQVGNGSASQANVLVPVNITPSGVTFKTISGGQLHTCGATTESGTARARCWGYNGEGALGNGSTTTAYDPVLTQVASPGDDDYSVIEAGGRHTCAVRGSTEIAYCWGRNSDGQLGDESNTGSLTRVQVSGGMTFTSIVVGQYFSCGIAGGDVYCWGDGSQGQLGNAQFTDANLPVRAKQ